MLIPGGMLIQQEVMIYCIECLKNSSITGFMKLLNFFTTELFVRNASDRCSSMPDFLIRIRQHIINEKRGGLLIKGARRPYSSYFIIKPLVIIIIIIKKGRQCKAERE